MGMTITEKILARHTDLAEVSPGMLINARVDIALGNDITAQKHAETALRVGLVDFVAPAGGLQEEVSRLTDRIAAQAPLAVARAKQLMRTHQEDTRLAGLRREGEAFLELFATADREEGMRAFMQKRPPAFSGR